MASKIGRVLVEVPVGFKWFVSGLLDGSLGFGGEESAGASFLRRDGTVWVTEKDGIIMDLLAVELMARTGRDPAEFYHGLTDQLGAPVYERIDAPATAQQKAVLLNLSAKDVKATELAGDPIETILTTAPGNGAAIGGHPDNPYLPDNFIPNTVVYTGTRDNPTSREWYEALPAVERENLSRYLKSPQLQNSAVAWELLRLAWSSVAALAIAPLQDLLNLGAEARMNVPGRPDGNWTWRCTQQMLSGHEFEVLCELTRNTRRLARAS